MSSRVGAQMDMMSDPQGKMALHWAIKNQNKYEIFKILSNVSHEDLKDFDRLGNSALHNVLTNQRLPEKDIIELLEEFLDRGNDVNAENNDGKTVIYFAVTRRMRDVIEFLIRCNAAVDARDRIGNSLAHEFVLNERTQFYKNLEFGKYYTEMPESTSFAEFLIEKGVDFDVRNKAGQSALHSAIEYNLQHILHVLVKHTRDIHFVDRQKKSLLHLFFEKNGSYRNNVYRVGLEKTWYSDYSSRYAAGIVRTLLDREVSTWPHDCDRNRTCLQTAIEHEEDMKIIETLVNNRLEITDENLATNMFSELLRSCGSWGESRTEFFLNILRDLIARGADVNAKDYRSGYTPLYHAVQSRNQNVVDFLNDAGAEIRANNDGGGNLFYALASNGRFEKQISDQRLEALFDLVVKKGCNNVNARDSTNDTPLHFTARCANLAIARKLIERGAEVNCKNMNGFTPLHAAVCLKENGKMVELLLNSGADVNSKDKTGHRPLYFAAGVSGNCEVVKMLLQRGAYVHDRDAEKSPLYAAIHDGYVKEMLKYGAGVDNVAASRLKYFQGIKSKPARKKQLVLQHWIKLKTAKMTCSKRHEIFDREFREYLEKDYQQLYEDCLKEIELLKNILIDSRTSIYGFLRMDFGYRRGHINNQKLRQLVESPELEEDFPQYSVVILASYRETVLWKSLLEPAKRAWLQLTKIELPDECIERILAFLRNEDLVSMMEHDEDAISQ